MSNLRYLSLGMILPLTLTVTACSDKDASQSETLASPVAESLNLSSVGQRDIEKLLSVKKRNVRADEADLALARWDLATSGSGPFTWDKKSGKAGTYTYENLTGTGKDGEIVNIEKLGLTGVHMVDDSATFDRMDIVGLDITKEDDLVTVDRLSLSRPSPKMGASIMDALERFETARKMKDLEIDINSDDMDFGAILMDGLSVSSPDGKVTLDTVGWGEDDTSSEAMFRLEGLDVSKPETPDEPAASLTLKSVSGTGLNMDMIREMRAAKGTDIEFNPLTAGFESFKLSDLEFVSDSLRLVAPEMSSQSKMQGEERVTKQVLKPVTLKFDGQPQSSEAIQAWNNLQKAGYDELEFSGSATSIVNEKTDTVEIKDSFFTLKDGFDLRFNMTGQGLSSVKDAQAAGVRGQDLINDVSIAALDVSLTDRSIVERGFAMAAADAGQSPNTLRQAAKSALFVAGFAMSMGADNKEQGRAVTEIINSLSSFLDDGGTMRVTLNPETPLPAGYLSNLQLETLDPVRMGLKVEHTP